MHRANWITGVAAGALQVATASTAVPASAVSMRHHVAPPSVASADERPQPQSRYRLAEPTVQGARGPVTGRGCPPITEVTFSVGDAHSAFAQLGQQATPLSGGGLGTAWEGGRFPRRKVRVQMLAPDGTPLPGGDGWSPSGPSDESQPVVAAHPWSGMFVAYRLAPNGEGGTIAAQWLDAAGVPQWPTDGIVVAPRPANEVQDEPLLAPASMGRWSSASGSRRSFASGSTVPGSACEARKASPRAPRKGCGSCPEPLPTAREACSSSGVPRARPCASRGNALRPTVLAGRGNTA